MGMHVSIMVIFACSAGEQTPQNGVTFVQKLTPVPYTASWPFPQTLSHLQRTNRLTIWHYTIKYTENTFN
jgi:hypothetical protein